MLLSIHIPAITITVTRPEPTIPPDIPAGEPGDLLSAFAALGHEALDIAQQTPPERIRDRVASFLAKAIRTLAGSDGVPEGEIDDEPTPTGEKS